MLSSNLIIHVFSVIGTWIMSSLKTVRLWSGSWTTGGGPVTNDSGTSFVNTFPTTTSHWVIFVFRSAYTLH